MCLITIPLKADKQTAFTNWLVRQGVEMLPLAGNELLKFKTPETTVVLWRMDNAHCAANSPVAVKIYKSWRTPGGNIDVRQSAPKRKNMLNDKLALMKSQGKSCVYCDEEFSQRNLTVEHLLSLVHGGRHTRINMALACKSCNQDADCLSVVDKLRLRDERRGINQSDLSVILAEPKSLFDAERLAAFAEWLKDHGAELQPLVMPRSHLAFKSPWGDGELYFSGRQQRLTSTTSTLIEAYESFERGEIFGDKARNNIRTRKTTLKRRDGDGCVFCDKTLQSHVHMLIVHFVPRLAGGACRLENQALSCPGCYQKTAHLSVLDKWRFRDRKRFGAHQSRLDRAAAKAEKLAS